VSGRFNFLLTDGAEIAATAAGDTLWYRSESAVTVASEPGDDAPGWVEVPDNTVVSATPRQVSVTQLDRHTQTADGRIPNR
jgi:glutamine amidotransferase